MPPSIACMRGNLPSRSNPCAKPETFTRCQGAQVWRAIKRPRNARGRVTQMALRRTNTPAFFPVSAHAPRLAIRRQYRPSIASNSGQGRVSVAAPAVLLSSPAGASGGTCPRAWCDPCAACEQRNGRCPSCVYHKPQNLIWIPFYGL
jgi:hypothetical protein